MFMRRSMGIVFVLLVCLGLLMAGSSMGYRAGWTQGVIAQHALSNGSHADGMLALPLQLGNPGGMFGPGLMGGGFGMLLFLLLVLMLVGIVLRAFAGHTWRTADGMHVSFGPDMWTWRCERRAQARGHGRGGKPEEPSSTETGERDVHTDDVS